MSKSTVSQETLERLLGNLSEASHRISKDVEKQAKQIDHKIKAFVESREKAGDKLIKTIDTEVRSQLESLRHEVEHLSHRINEMVSDATSKKAPKHETSDKAEQTAPVVATKKTAARKPASGKPAPPAARKPAARKAPAKRATAS